MFFNSMVAESEFVGDGLDVCSERSELRATAAAVMAAKWNGFGEDVRRTCTMGGGGRKGVLESGIRGLFSGVGSTTSMPTVASWDWVLGREEGDEEEEEEDEDEEEVWKSFW